MKSQRRGRFRIAWGSLGKRFKPNPLVNAPTIDVEMAADICRCPALAEKFMHAGEQSLQPFQSVSAIEVRPTDPRGEVEAAPEAEQPPLADVPPDARGEADAAAEVERPPPAARQSR
jgi:hypothetical protein